MKERKIMARTFEKGTPEWEAWRAKISASKKGNSPAPNKGIPHSEETRQKIKEARAKQIFTPDRNARISATMKAKYAQGDIVSPESRANAAAKLRGRPMHPHAKAALRTANVGGKHSEEHKAKISTGNKKAFQNPEIRAKISQTSKGRTQSAETRAKRSALMKAKWNNMTPEKKAQRIDMLFRISQAQGISSRLEEIIAQQLDTQGILYKRQEKIGWYRVDFYIPAENRVIEINGCYWHCCEQCGFAEAIPGKHEKDQKRYEHLKRKGYHVEIIWEHDIPHKLH